MTGIGTFFKMAKPSVVPVGQVRQIVRMGSELTICYTAFAPHQEIECRARYLTLASHLSSFRGAMPSM